VADNYSESGQLIATEWMCAEAVRRGVFPASRAQRKRAVVEEAAPKARGEAGKV
jgi:hypothetical protein